MKSEHAVGLELSKQMKKVGWKKETKFWWIKSTVKNEGYLFVNNETFLAFFVWHHKVSDKNEWFSAPLATEILEEFKKLKKVTIVIFYHKNNWVCQDITYHYKIPIFRDKNNLCNALAKMWLYLKKEGLL